MRGNPIISSFNAGELSPALYGRVDLAKYFNGCELLENMIVRPHGEAFKRPGTEYIGEVTNRDIVTDGGFDDAGEWVAGFGWEVTGSKAVATAGSLSNLDQYTGVDSCVVGATYEVTFTISNYVAGSVAPYIFQTLGTSRGSDGTFTEQLTCNAVWNRLGLQKIALFEGDIDNFSVRGIGSNKVRLEPFEFSTTQAYMLEFLEKNIRVYKDGALIDDLEIATPYLEADIFDLQMTQSADVMTIVHENYAPRELSRTSHTDWTLTEIDFIDGPYEAEKYMGDIASMTITGVTLADPCVITVDEAIASNDDWIKIDNVEGTVELNLNYYKLAGKSGLTYQLTDGTNDIDSTGFTAYSARGTAICTLKFSSSTIICWEDFFVATDVGRLIRLKLDDWLEGSAWGYWKNDTAYTPGSNVSASGGIYRCIVENTDKIPPNAMYWRELGKDSWFWFKITAFTSTKQVSITPKDDIDDSLLYLLQGATVAYRMGAWGEANGYPSCVEYYEDRLVFAGSDEYPQTIWGSASGNYDYFVPGTNDDDAFTYTLNARGVNAIKWIVPQNFLLIGTKGSEWRVGASNTEEPMSPSNIQAKRQTSNGSKRVQAVLAGDAVLFVQRAGTKLRELAEDPTSLSEKYVAPDLTLLSEHITEGGITDIAYQQEPTSILWCVRADGVLLGMTYERTQDVVGWHRHFTYEGEDEIESVAVMTTEGEDEVWIAVKREIDGESLRYIERFKPWRWGSDVKDCFFVDSGLTLDNGDAVIITGATQADPVVVTSEAHGFSDADLVKILSVVGMTELNENTYKIANKTDDTFELTDTDDNDIDGTGFTAYVSGGTAQQVVKEVTVAHLIGREVSILADGYAVKPRTVSAAGTITLAYYANKIHVGLGYTSKLKPMNIEAGAQAGTAQNKVKRIHKCGVRLRNTLSCKMGSCEEDLEEIAFRNDADSADTPGALFSGDKDIHAFPGGYDTNGDILIVNDKPLPLTVIAILPELVTQDL